MPAVPALAYALAAGFAFGIASVLQRIGATRTAGVRSVGLGLLRDLAAQPLFVAGAALDAAGFALTLVAVHRLPLFVVQAALCSSLAVTAVLAAWSLGERLRGYEWGAVAATGLGLFLLGVSASEQGPPQAGGGRLLILAGLPLLAVAGSVASRGGFRAQIAAPTLGALAGASFAAFSVCGRLLPTHPSLLSLATDPLIWGATLYAILGLVLFGAALQRGLVTAVTAACVAVEALLPAAAGLLLADHARPGSGAIALAGFALTLVAAGCLATSPSTGGDAESALGVSDPEKVVRSVVDLGVEVEPLT